MKIDAHRTAYRAGEYAGEIKPRLPTRLDQMLRSDDERLAAHAVNLLLASCVEIARGIGFP